MMRTLGLVLFGVCLSAQPVSAQLGFAVCNEVCPNSLTDPAGAATCAGRITLCNTKLGLYNSYMGQLGLGVARHQLPQLYRDVLAPFYSRVVVDGYRFGFSDRQPPNNATTDCNVTYYSNVGYVDSLRTGILDHNWDWLFHEIRHFEQCMSRGSRDAYAKGWFGQLELTFLQNNDLATLHDRMPMEGDADNKASSVLTSTQPFRDINNRLVKPFAVTVQNSAGTTITSSTGFVNVAQSYAAQISGGSSPRDIIWSVKVPGSSLFNNLIGTESNNDRNYTFTPTAAGTHTVRVRVRQPGSNLVDAVRDVTVTVYSRPKSLP